MGLTLSETITLDASRRAPTAVGLTFDPQEEEIPNKRRWDMEYWLSGILFLVLVLIIAWNLDRRKRESIMTRKAARHEARRPQKGKKR